MLIREELQALRSDDAPQRQAQAELCSAVDAWRASPRCRALEAELARFATGTALARLPALSGLFSPDDLAARSLVDELIATLAAQLEDRPLGQVPLRSSTDGTLSTLILASTGKTALVVQAVDGQALARRSAGVTISFAPGETWEHVLSGSAEADLVRIAGPVPGGAALKRTPCVLSPGQINFRDSACESLQLRSVPTSLVTLKLQRRLAAGATSREYRLDDGSLVHQAAASARASRLELAASLLGRMGRKDAAPLLVAMAEEQGGRSLRWQALRECLALDTAQGFAVLCRIAARSDDPLAEPAGALRAHLLETYPQLRELAECRE
ncbi:MAG: hypothetical protein C0515_00320 [Novosphingobium sp.]|nr:hypothetical protein [Novosphingobium sp.]